MLSIDKAFKHQLVRLGMVPKALKRRTIMNINDRRIATLLGEERLELISQFGWQIAYLNLAYQRLGVGEDRRTDTEILDVYERMAKYGRLNHNGQRVDCLTLADFPEIEGFIIVDDTMITSPMKWSEVPFVYQYYMWSKRPNPPGLDTVMRQFGPDEVILKTDGAYTFIWDKELIFYDKGQKCVDSHSLVAHGMGLGDIIDRNGWDVLSWEFPEELSKKAE